jgi:flagellar protein FliS
VTKRGASTYQIQQVMTASPMALVAMLYEKAIQSLKEAIAAIEAGDIQGRWKASNRAFEIIQHLQMTLDLEKGGVIARNLDQLYGLMLRLLPNVNMKNDPAPALEVIRLLEPLRDSWRQASAKKAGTSAKPVGRPAEPGASQRTDLSA